VEATDASSIPKTIKRHTTDMQVLAEALSRTVTTGEVARAVFEHLLPLIGASAGTLVLRTEDGAALELVGAAGYSQATLDAFRRIPLHASTPAAEVARTRQPLWMGSTAQAFPSFAERSTGHNALAVLPLVIDEEVTGALGLAFAQERSFDAHERSLLLAIAAECAIALQRAEAFARERANRERLELALQAGSMGTWDWDVRGNRVAWSPQLERMHGREQGAFGDGLETYFAHLHPEDLERVRANIEHSLQSGELRIEYRGLWPNGEVHWFEARGKLTRTADGQPAALRGVCIDVTDRKQAEQALRESEERFRTLADNIAPLAWMADANGSRFWYSQRWYDYTGASAEAIQGWGWTSVHHPDHVERVTSGIKRACETGQPWEDTFPLRGRDGRYRWFLSRAVPIRDDQGRLIRWLGTNTDITERRSTEALIAGERNALELIARGSPIGAVLAELCRTVEHLAEDGLLASVLLLDRDGVHLRHGAGPSLPDG
jgi:PAS domain S-box-containing protein